MLDLILKIYTIFWKSISLILQGIGFVSAGLVGGLDKKFSLAFS